MMLTYNDHGEIFAWRLAYVKLTCQINLTKLLIRSTRGTIRKKIAHLLYVGYKKHLKVFGGINFNVGQF